ncbi:MAG: sulfite exporter TauE/SafE family protein [Rudaea sp.]
MIAEYVALAAAALVVGFFIGAVGVGGILLVPALAWLGVPIHQATATALFSFLFTGFVGTWLFQRRGSIDWAITRPVLAGALVFSYVGARVNAMFDAATLTLVIAMAVAAAGIYMLLPARRPVPRHRDGRSTRNRVSLVCVGAFAGFGSGLSGAGGPLFSVPTMLMLGFVPLATIGAGQVLQIVAALFGTVGNLQFGSIDYALGGLLVAAETAGMVAGARAAHIVSMRWLRRTAAALCVLTGTLLLVQTL